MVGVNVPRKLLMLQEHAIKAGMEDYRFPPITLSELAGLRVRVTIIQCMDGLHDYDDMAGTSYGLLLLVKDGYGRNFSANLAGDVVATLVKRGGKDLALRTLCRKAGYMGGHRDLFRRERRAVVLRLYESSCTMNFEEYQHQLRQRLSPPTYPPCDLQPQPAAPIHVPAAPLPPAAAPSSPPTKLSRRKTSRGLITSLADRKASLGSEASATSARSISNRLWSRDSGSGSSHKRSSLLASSSSHAGDPPSASLPLGTRDLNSRSQPSAWQLCLGLDTSVP